MLYLLDGDDNDVLVCRCRLFHNETNQTIEVEEECKDFRFTLKFIEKLQGLDINKQQQALKVLFQNG